jgi:hypothetical protein
MVAKRHRQIMLSANHAENVKVVLLALLRLLTIKSIRNASARILYHTLNAPKYMNNVLAIYEKIAAQQPVVTMLGAGVGTSKSDKLMLFFLVSAPQ